MLSLRYDALPRLRRQQQPQPADADERGQPVCGRALRSAAQPEALARGLLPKAARPGARHAGECGPALGPSKDRQWPLGWKAEHQCSVRCGVALGMVGGDVMRLVQRTEPQSHTLLTEDSTRGAWKRLPAHSPVLSSSSNIKITHETRSKTRGQHVK